MSHNIYKRIEIREDPIAYREFLCITRGMLLIKHTDTLLRQILFPVGVEPPLLKCSRYVQKSI